MEMCVRNRMTGASAAVLLEPGDTMSVVRDKVAAVLGMEAKSMSVWYEGEAVVGDEGVTVCETTLAVGGLLEAETGEELLRAEQVAKEEEFYFAATNGTVPWVRRCLRDGFPVVNTDAEREPLRGALINQHAEVCEILFEAGAPVTPHLDALTAAMEKAAEEGDLAMVRLAMRMGACAASTRLLFKARKGVVRVLLDAGARGAHDAGLLCRAVREDDLDAIEALLEAGADPNAAGALLLAKGCNAARLLLQHGASPNVRDPETGDTPLHRAESIEHATLLLQHGASASAKCRKGHTPWFRRPHLGLHFGDSLDLTDSNGFSLLCFTKDERVLSHCRDVNKDAPLGNWFLGDYKRERNFRLTRLLLNAGASPDVYSKSKGDTVFVYAVKKLRSVRQPLEEVVGIIRDFANAGDVNKPSPGSGQTPLLAAVQLPATPNKKVIIRTLLVSGADPNVRNSRSGVTPLIALLRYIAKTGVSFDHYQVQQLLSSGASASVVSWTRDTAVLAALRISNIETELLLRLLQMLLDAGGDVNSGGPLSPLLTALRRWDALEVVDFLLKAGADPNVAGSDGQRPLEVAVTLQDCGAIVEALQEAGAVHCAEPEYKRRGNSEKKKGKGKEKEGEKRKEKKKKKEKKDQSARSLPIPFFAGR